MQIRERLEANYFFSFNVIYVFNSAAEQQMMMKEVQFDVIMTSLPFGV